MRTVKFVTRRRGFFNHLEKTEKKDVKFLFSEDSFEVPSLKRRLGSKIIRSNIADSLGIIQRINSNQTENIDIILGSFNRFLSTNTKYLIYLENPTAIFHYSLNRNKTLLGKKRFQEYISDNNLCYFICMSHACMNSIYENFLPTVNSINQKVIYPLVRTNTNVSEEKIRSKRKNNENLNLLFIAQGSRFVSKGGIEVIYALKELENTGISCTIITNIDKLDSKKKLMIKECSSIKLVDFNLSYSEMEKVYFDHDVLIHPSSDDSFGVTVLEAMKSGLPIISTNLYAFPEMVSERENGFMTDPKWNFFDKNNIPNKEVWNNRKKTLYSEKPSKRIVSFLVDKIQFFSNNPEKLMQMSLNSYKKANSEPFSEDFILKEWIKVYDEIKCM